MESSIQRGDFLPEDLRQTFEVTKQAFLRKSFAWPENYPLTRPEAERALAQRRVEYFKTLFRQFCDDPASRAEHDRLLNVMPDSWKLKPFMFSKAV